MLLPYRRCCNWRTLSGALVCACALVGLVNILSHSSLDRRVTVFEQPHQQAAHIKYWNYKADGARGGNLAPNFKPRPRPEQFHLRATTSAPSLLQQLADDPIMSTSFTGLENERFRRQYLVIEDNDKESLKSTLKRHSVHKVSSSNSLWWPSSEHSRVVNDRILKQMRHVPHSYRASEANRTLKVIYVPGGFGNTPMGEKIFLKEECPVDACLLTDDSSYARTADMRLLQADAVFSQSHRKPAHQIWTMFILESPANTLMFEESENVINWTATYRWDSTIVTPYAKFVKSNNRSIQSTQTNVQNYAEGKSRMAAWFVSNCNAKNNRTEFVRELSRYVQIDIYGVCGSFTCARSDSSCFGRLKNDYKFYLSFENSNCDHYITEKFFENALLNDVVPVVMGGRLQDYQKAAPRHSFIHVDQFKSVADLAKYLHFLDQNDHKYNEYFLWKGSGQFINTKFWCRLCALLHDDSKPHMWYEDFGRWWSHQGACRIGKWN